MAEYRHYCQQLSHCWKRFAWGSLGALLLLLAPALATPPDEAEIVLSQTPVELKPYAIALGERLQKPGKERIAASGTITFFGNEGPQTEAVRVTWQIPLKMRLDRGGSKLIADRNNPGQTIPGTQKEADMARTLLEDSAEGFFAMQKNRIFRRYLGSGFKLEGAKETESGMDVLLMAYADNSPDKAPLLKSYWFDSSTKLLGVVAYRSTSGAATHIVIDDWRDVSGEKLPFRIERWEDNTLMARLILDSAAFMAGANDGTFGEN